MTEQELIKSICKGSTYAYRCQKLAYEEMTRFNDYVKYLHEMKKQLRENGQLMNGFKMPRPGKKPVYFTIYTKIPRFRSYRQQIAITYATLWKKDLERLKARDAYARWNCVTNEDLEAMHSEENDYYDEDEEEVYFEELDLDDLD